MSILRLEDTMPRNTKCRKIFCFPDYYGFVPEEVGADHIETILMSLDEYEVIRLLDYEGLNQQECALRMDVARTTVTAMYENARKKLVRAIVEGKRLRIAGGNVKIDRERIGVPVNLKILERLRNSRFMISKTGRLLILKFWTPMERDAEHWRAF